MACEQGAGAERDFSRLSGLDLACGLCFWGDLCDRGGGQEVGSRRAGSARPPTSSQRAQAGAPPWRASVSLLHPGNHSCRATGINLAGPWRGLAHDWCQLGWEGRALGARGIVGGSLPGLKPPHPLYYSLVWGGGGPCSGLLCVDGPPVRYNGHGHVPLPLPASVSLMLGVGDTRSCCGRGEGVL